MQKCVSLEPLSLYLYKINVFVFSILFDFFFIIGAINEISIWLNETANIDF